MDEGQDGPTCLCELISPHLSPFSKESLEVAEHLAPGGEQWQPEKDRRESGRECEEGREGGTVRVGGSKRDKKAMLQPINQSKLN